MRLRTCPLRKACYRQAAIKEADTKSFSDRTNIKRNWVGDHRIVPSLSGDIAFEYGTLHISSDSKGKPGAGHEEFEAVMLIVYKSEGRGLPAGRSNDAAAG